MSTLMAVLRSFPNPVSCNLMVGAKQPARPNDSAEGPDKMYRSLELPGAVGPQLRKDRKAELSWNFAKKYLCASVTLWFSS